MTSAVNQIDNFYRAILRQEVRNICQSYVPQEDTYVFVEGPRYSTIGYSKIAKGWQDFCNSTVKLEKIEWIEGPFTEEIENLAWVAGIVLLTVTVKARSIQRTFRATFVLNKNEAGSWQIRHEHLSAPLDDPYGIGDWLNKNEQP
ncbi:MULTISPECIES: YybH family protein [Nostocales]|uniref:SnoaL-like domain-containing protein n=3 Tax=Nostocales TaxID=1161 RepID=A0A0C1RJ48_9CYAN|nr:nuclear transport factor 2 family protein [Tolypothrix bouteillei]KAF3890681.1 SnoaL-like domain-containing protein [Tolypothrix bouteillei VB521301]